jgi:hypothetical protein
MVAAVIYKFCQLLTCVIICCLGFPNVFSQASERKLIIPKNNTFQLHTDSIYLDTLILKDNSILRFTSSTLLIVENAFIGTNCQFDASGQAGLNGTSPTTGIASLDGEAGTAGYDLNLIINFKSLGTLLITTEGGMGGNGASGKTGPSGLNGSMNEADGGRGENGGKGGNGGNGGNILLHYWSDNFLISFATAKTNQHLIKFNYSGGRPGLGGDGGRGGRAGEPIISLNSSITGVRGKEGLSGTKGNNGLPGLDGELFLKRLTN